MGKYHLSISTGFKLSPNAEHLYKSNSSDRFWSSGAFKSALRESHREILKLPAGLTQVASKNPPEELVGMEVQRSGQSG